MKDVCKRGHALTGDNISIQLNGFGQPGVTCRQCNRERAKLWRQKNAYRLMRKSPGNGSSVRPGQTLVCR